MDYIKNLKNNHVYLLLIPAVLAFLIALIPTLKYQWPLSWDIYYHVHLSKLYLEQGFTLYDNLTYAPFGRPIIYPPLFHYVLAGGYVLFKTDIFQITRLIQPILAFSVVLSFTYVSYKLYGLRVGILAAFFLMFSAVFYRFILPIPETIAFILFMPTLYLYYSSLENDNLKYAVLSGILCGLVFLTHALTATIMVGVLAIFTLVLKLRNERLKYVYLWFFLSSTLLVAAIWYFPLLFQYGYPFHNPQGEILNPLSYLIVLVKTLGIPAIIFGIIGVFCLIKKDSKGNWFRKDVLIISWITSLLILSNAYLLHINILVDRILNFAVFPVVILAALGLEYIRTRYTKKIFTIIISFLIITAILSGVFYTTTSVKPAISPAQHDLAQWFTKNGDKQGVVMSLVEGLDPILVSISRQPVSTGGYHPGMIKVLDRNKYYSGNYQESDLQKDKIGYFVTRSGVKPSYTTLVYKNNEYQIWRYISA